MAPTAVPSGAGMRLPRRMKIGAFETSRMVIFETATSSMCAPSTLSMRQPPRRIEDHVGNRDIAKIAFRFGADLDPPRGTVAVGHLLPRALVSAIYQAIRHRTRSPGNS